jgi:hypothetical protein
MAERVQVQGLGDAPTVQPVNLPGYQYGINQRRASAVGRNKLMDLADALSQVNPILSQYSQIRQFKREEAIAAGQQFLTEQPEQAVATLEAGLGKTKRELRKLADQGIIDERSNPDFLLGIRAAKGKNLARQFRTELLTNPEALNQEDPNAYIQGRVSEFFNRPEIADSEYTKTQVQPLLESITNEYIGQATRIQQDIEIARGKTDWIESTQDSVEDWKDNKIDLFSPTFSAWLNDGAGNFKGSNKYALDNLFKPAIMDLVESGDISTAIQKTGELKAWIVNKDTGAKFINAELRDDLDNFEVTILNQSTYFQKKAAEAYNTQKDNITKPFIAEFQRNLNDGVTITDSLLKDWSNRLREEGLKGSVNSFDIEETIQSMRELSNKTYNSANNDVETDTEMWSMLQADLDLGLDIQADLNDASEQGLIDQEDFKTLQKLNGDSDRFQKEIMGLASVKQYTQLFENQYKDTTLKNELTGLVAASTNAIKDITDYDAHPNALQSLKIKGTRGWRSELKRYRDGIVQSNPDITPQQLDERINSEIETLYTVYNEKYTEIMKAELRTGMYILDSQSEDITLDSIENTIKAIEDEDPALMDGKVTTLFEKIDLIDGSLDAQLRFLKTYRDKIK